MKKGLRKFGQSIGEKTGSYQKTEMETEFVRYVEYTDHLKKGLEAIVGATEEFMYPDSASRNLARIQKSRRYKFPEIVLADALTTQGSNIGSETGMLGPILEYMGEVEKQVGDAHYQFEADVQSMVLEPMNSYLAADIKEVMNHKKKLHSRRLDFDAKRRDLSKKPDDEKIRDSHRIAEGKFEESKELTKQGMFALTQGEAGQISQLLAFVDAQKNFHAGALRALDGLTEYLQERLSEADSMVPPSYSNAPVERTATPPGAAGVRVVTAVFEFIAENDGELTFPVDARVTVTKEIDDNWLEGDYNGHRGIFPRTYVVQ